MYSYRLTLSKEKDTKIQVNRGLDSISLLNREGLDNFINQKLTKAEAIELAEALLEAAK